ncbi:MAG: hypothetical protein R3E91_04045 [Chlamydiales bacterium]
MNEDMSGIRREPQMPIHPISSSNMDGMKSELQDKSMEQAFHIPVSNLNQLKNVLVDRLGEKEGMKSYIHFMSLFAQQIFSQIRQSADHAQKASKEMRKNE